MTELEEFQRSRAPDIQMESSKRSRVTCLDPAQIVPRERQRSYAFTRCGKNCVADRRTNVRDDLFPDAKYPMITLQIFDPDMLRKICHLDDREVMKIAVYCAA